MSEPPELRGITEYIFTWFSLSDACPKCRALNGKDFRDQNLYQNVLWDPIWGDLWDLNRDIPLTHPNCRCQLTVRVEIDLSKADWLRDLSDATRKMI